MEELWKFSLKSVQELQQENWFRFPFFNFFLFRFYAGACRSILRFRCQNGNWKSNRTFLHLDTRYFGPFCSHQKRLCAKCSHTQSHTINARFGYKYDNDARVTRVHRDFFFTFLLIFALFSQIFLFRWRMKRKSNHILKEKNDQKNFFLPFQLNFQPDDRNETTRKGVRRAKFSENSKCWTNYILFQNNRPFCAWIIRREMNILQSKRVAAHTLIQK